MDKLKFEQKSLETNISTTLYRALFLLKLLQDKGLSILEIKQACAKNKYIGSKISDDTIRMTFATLKSVGCVFAKPTVKNNFTYRIIQSPFKYTLDEDDIDFLSDTREQLASFISWNNLSKINNLYEKLNNQINENENKFSLSRQSVFPNINLKILEQLEELCEEKKYISILYKSQNVLKNIEIIPFFIRYENEYLYLWCYNESHQDYSFLRLDRIKKINKILQDKKLPKFKKYKLIAEIEKSRIDIFKRNYSVNILETTQDYYKAEIEYISEFHIIQTILELSPYCKILEPSNIKEKFVNNLKNMRNLYR